MVSSSCCCEDKILSHTLRELAASARNAVPNGDCVRVQSNDMNEAIEWMDALVTMGGIKEC
jgi:hypothetical protein